MELNRVLELWSMTECDGAMSEHDRTMMDVASTYALCPRFEEPSVR